MDDDDGKHKQMHNTLESQALLSMATHMMQMLFIEHGVLWNEFVVPACHILDLVVQLAQEVHSFTDVFNLHSSDRNCCSSFKYLISSKHHTSL